MEKKTFSVKDGTLRINNNELRIYSNMDDKEGRMCIGSTNKDYCTNNHHIYLLPSTLIRNQTDEELAEEKYPYVKGDSSFYQRIREANIKGFLAGLKARGGEFHLTTEQLENVIDNARKFTVSKDSYGFSTQPRWKYRKDDIISSLTPPIYPTTITVDYDGENYYWEILKAEY